jgi:hypothetical protein
MNLKHWWVIYDDRGIAIALVERYEESPPSIHRRQKVVKSLRLSELPEYDQKQVIEIFRGGASDNGKPRASTSGKRQRNGGHGYAGGDGFRDI